MRDAFYFVLAAGLIILVVGTIDYIATKLWISKTRHRRAEEEED